MSIHIKFTIVFLAYFICLPGRNIAQDLRDKEHTQRFADYLFLSGQYPLASEEYERLVYLDSVSEYSKLKLLQSYRLAGKPGNSIKRLQLFYGDSLQFLKNDFAEEYVKNLILEKENDKLFDFLKGNSNLNENSRQNYMLAGLLLEKDWNKAFNYALKNPVTNDKKNADLHLIAFKSKQIKYKSPFTASLLSTIVPGTGKFYTKYWKDGLISMMLVGLNAWQSYRGFHKYGSKSAYGWVFGGIASGFYIGNVYGSYQSAKKYNRKTDDEMYNNAWHLIVDDF